MNKLSSLLTAMLFAALLMLPSFVRAMENQPIDDPTFYIDPSLSWQAKGAEAVITLDVGKEVSFKATKHPDYSVIWGYDSNVLSCKNTESFYITCTPHKISATTITAKFEHLQTKKVVRSINMYTVLVSEPANLAATIFSNPPAANNVVYASVGDQIIFALKQKPGEGIGTSWPLSNPDVLSCAPTKSFMELVCKVLGPGDVKVFAQLQSSHNLFSQSNVIMVRAKGTAPAGGVNGIDETLLEEDTDISEGALTYTLQTLDVHKRLLRYKNNKAQKVLKFMVTFQFTGEGDYHFAKGEDPYIGGISCRFGVGEGKPPYVYSTKFLYNGPSPLTPKANIDLTVFVPLDQSYVKYLKEGQNACNIGFMGDNSNVVDFSIVKKGLTLQLVRL